MSEDKLPNYNHQEVHKVANSHLVTLPHILEPLYTGILLFAPALVWASRRDGRYNHLICVLINNSKVGDGSQFSYLEEVELR